MNDDEKDSSDTSPFEEKKPIGPPRVVPRKNIPVSLKISRQIDNVRYLDTK